jgi:uncharacterized membrane protein
MDVLTVVLLLIILIIIITNKMSVSDKLRDLEYKIIELQSLLRLYQAKSAEKLKEEAKPDPVTPPIGVKAPVPPVAEVKPPGPVEVKPEPVVERQKEVINDPLAAIRKPVKTDDWDKRAKPPKPEPEPELSFFERYPDLEKFIGENLVNKIGIVILVLAIAFFVKYAIDNNWIGPVWRVGIGILCGAILVGVAHYFRNSYRAFSSVMAGGGLAVFYFTITLAFQLFHLFSQPVAFAILIVITIFAVVLSLLYNKQELAVIALIGGFASPFMVSNGSANYNALFIYLLILNTGLLIIAYFKAWRILNISSFVLSVVVFATVLYTLTPANYSIGLQYATVFYLLFFTINIINNIRENKSFVAIDFSILLVNTALYFATGLYLLTEMHQIEYRGMFSAALALINLVLSYILFRKKTVDPNILYLLIGITLTFISLTAPIQLHGSHITLFWSAETVLLYWLYLKSGIKLMKLTSMAIWFIMLISLLIDIADIYAYSNAALPIIANKGFITILCGAISSYLLFLLVKKDTNKQIYGLPVFANLYRVMAFILVFTAGFLEVNYQFNHYYPDTNLNILYLSLYVPVFVYVFCILSARINRDGFSWRAGLGLFVCTLIVYLAFMPSFFSLLRIMVEGKKIALSHFTAHWISAIFIGLIFYRVINLCRTNFDEGVKNTASWILSGAIVLFFSLEFSLASIRLFYSAANGVDLIETVYIKTGLPVLWGVLSFILMWLGMSRKLRALRIISLSLFLITLVKLFLFDINNIPVAGKIIAFFCLGILLLIISFMYQKVKKILVDDEAKAKE